MQIADWRLPIGDELKPVYLNCDNSVPMRESSGVFFVKDLTHEHSHSRESV